MTPSTVDLCLALTLAQSRLALVVDEALGIHHGLSLRELALLDALRQGPAGGSSLRALAAALSQSASATLRQALPLEKTGLVERTTPGLALRPAGTRVLKQARDTAEEAGQETLAAWPGGERLHLLGLLTALATGRAPASAAA